MVHDVMNSCNFLINLGMFRHLKVLLYTQARASNEGEGASKSIIGIITDFNFLLASKMFFWSNIYG